MDEDEIVVEETDEIPEPTFTVWETPPVWEGFPIMIPEGFDTSEKKTPKKSSKKR